MEELIKENLRLSLEIKLLKKKIAKMQYENIRKEVSGK